MFRLVTAAVGSVALVLGIAGVAAAQEPPALEAPALEAPRAESPPAPPPAAAPATAVQPKVETAASARPNASAGPAIAPASGRPMLAIPGITAPASRRPATSGSPAGPRAPAGSASPGPALDALPPPPPNARSRATGMNGIPLSEPPTAAALPPAVNSPRTARPFPDSDGLRSRPVPGRPAAESIPLSIEPMDGDSPVDRRPTGRAAIGRAADGAGPSSRLQDDEPDDRPPPARRPSTFLGRLFAPPPPTPARRKPPDEEQAEGKPRGGSDADSRLTPEAEARRRIERQIRATLGDKLRSFEVHVTGRNVEIVAQPSRFWLRRSVRHSLETLPALQGFRARIEISD